MKKIVLILLMLMPIFSSQAQENFIKLKFLLENEEVKLDSSFRLTFVIETDTIESLIEDGRFLLPTRIDRVRKIDFVFYYGDYRLDFTSIGVNPFRERQVWVIGVDRKPFGKDNIKLIRKRRAKTFLIYYLNDGNSLTTVSKWK